jgi:hypothetical protein
MSQFHRDCIFAIVIVLAYILSGLVIFFSPYGKKA